MNAMTENEQALTEKFGGLLHDYQTRCVAALDTFAENIPLDGAANAFNQLAPEGWRYRPAPHMPDTPHVCVKVPTGGGKTLIAAASIGPLSAHMQREHPFVLWFAPTGAIVEQTLRALRDPENRCRRALNLWFPENRINPIPLREAYLLSPSDFRERVNIIVSTIQSVRKEDTEGRKIYDNAGSKRNFQGLLEALSAEFREEDGRIVRSLANVFRLAHPMIVVDEADEARSKVSFKSLARFSPSWILEITATPKTAQDSQFAASNVLHQVSAADLQNCDMIKFPLKIRAGDDWRATIRAAVEKRDALEVEAKGEFVPVALFHAEAKNQQVPAEDVRLALIRDLKIPEEQVAVAVGGKELDANVGTSRSPIRHVITVRQLARGWDCPAAYVLGSVSNLQSQSAVEQLLGRVLRMPGARRRDGDLGKAHVFAARTNFAQASRDIAEMLKARHGFKPDEAKRMTEEEPLFPPPVGDSPSEPTAPFRIPRLVIKIDGEAELFERSHFFLGEPWKVAGLNASLQTFTPEATVTRGEVGFNQAGRVVRRPDKSETARAALFESDKEWTMPGLMAWLCRRIPHDDIPSGQMVPFVRSALEGVKTKHGMDDAELAANRFGLERAIAARLREHRTNYRSGKFQQSLKGMLGGMPLETSAEHALEISESRYQPRKLCEHITFKHHLFPNKVGKFDGEGEEEDCAVHIDSGVPEVEVWLRNLDRDIHAFWLQTSKQLFYPDFVARLKDGRYLVVEYKGRLLWDLPETQEKRDIGKTWADLSNGRCVFVMVCQDKGRGLQEINYAVSGKAL